MHLSRRKGVLSTKKYAKNTKHTEYSETFLYYCNIVQNIHIYIIIFILKFGTAALLSCDYMEGVRFMYVFCTHPNIDVFEHTGDFMEKVP